MSIAVVLTSVYAASGPPRNREWSRRHDGWLVRQVAFGARAGATGESLFKGQCHCRECQYISGGHPNVVMAMPESGFAYSAGSPKQYRRRDLPNPVTREFCPECGTHILTRTPAVPGAVLLKVGTFDDPSVFGGPQMVIFTIDKQAFHHVPEGVPSFERVPG